MELHCGFDSKRFVRGKFQALLGVGITTKEPMALKEKYEEILEQLFQKYSIPRRRPIYKSYDLKSIFMPFGVSACQYFMENINDSLFSLDLYYSYFHSPDVDKQEFIRIYYKEASGAENVNAIKLLDLIEHAYPAICAWKYILNNPSAKCHAYIDHFKAKPSNLLTEIKDVQNIHVLYTGDKCNHLISTADILLNAIEEQIKKRNIPLNRQIYPLLEETFPEKHSIEYLGKMHLYNLTPSNKIELDFSHRVKHPIYFIFMEEDNFVKTFGNINERDFVEKSKIYDSVLTEVSKKEGCLKFFEGKDQVTINEEDIFICYGDKGQKKINFLKSLGFNNATINYSNQSQEKEKK